MHEARQKFTLRILHAEELAIENFALLFLTRHPEKGFAFEMAA